MTTIDPTPTEIADAVADCLTTITRVGEHGHFLTLKAVASDERTITVEVHDLGFGTIGVPVRTLLMHLVYLDGEQAPPTTGPVDPVIARGGAA